MIYWKCFVFNPIYENTYVVYDDTKSCIIIDPGCYERREEQALASFIEEKGLDVKRLINTHCHVDHVLGNAFVKSKYKVLLEIPEAEAELLRAVEAYAPNYGFVSYHPSEANHFIAAGEEIEFGDSSLEILSAPGHSPGHVVFLESAQKVCFSGDVLFHESIGRTDLPGGNTDTLMNTLHQVMMKLPDDVKICPGHGPETTIGHERTNNPFLVA